MRMPASRAASSTVWSGRASIVRPSIVTFGIGSSPELVLVAAWSLKQLPRPRPEIGRAQDLFREKGPLELHAGHPVLSGAGPLPHTGARDGDSGNATGVADGG